MGGRFMAMLLRQCAGAPTGAPQSYSKGVARVASPLVYEGLLYYVNMDGILTALNAKTGETMKVSRFDGALENYYASPVAAAGHMVRANRRLEG